MIQTFRHTKNLVFRGFLYSLLIAASFHTADFILWHPESDYSDKTWLVNIYLPFGVIAYIAWLEKAWLTFYALPGAVYIDWLRYGDDAGNFILASTASVLSLIAIGLLFKLANQLLCKGIAYFKARNFAALFVFGALINSLSKTAIMGLTLKISIGYVVGAINGALLATFVVWAALKFPAYILRCWMRNR